MTSECLPNVRHWDSKLYFSYCVELVCEPQLQQRMLVWNKVSAEWHILEVSSTVQMTKEGYFSGAGKPWRFQLVSAMETHMVWWPRIS